MVLFRSFQYLLLLNSIYLCFSMVTTITTLNLESYVGRWYQIYGNKFDQFFEKLASCITADYGLIPSGNISVLNSQYEDNKIVQIEGHAYYSSMNKNPSLFPGQLTVNLDGVPHDSPYWVYNLGPENSENNDYYDWALVSDPLKLSLFVLARDVNDYYENYDSEVLELLNK